MAPSGNLGIFGYPDHSGSGNLNLENLVSGGGVYIYSDGTTLVFQVSGSYVTYTSEPSILGSKRLVAGENIIIDESIPGQLTLLAQATGSTGATNNGSYICVNTEPSLPQERRLDVGAGLSLADGGANSTITVGLGTSLTNATFITVGPETLLTGERRLTVDGGLSIYDSGANSTLTVTGSALQYTGTTSTSSTVNLTAHSTRVQLADCSSNAITYNLPAAASAGDKIFIFKKIDGTANTVTLDPNGSETIDGGATYVIPLPNMTISLYSDSSAWWII